MVWNVEQKKFIFLVVIWIEPLRSLEYRNILKLFFFSFTCKILVKLRTNDMLDKLYEF